MQAYPVPSSDGETKTTTSTPSGTDMIPILDNMVVLHKALNTEQMDTDEKEWWDDQVWFEESISKENFSFEYNEVSISK